MTIFFTADTHFGHNGILKYRYWTNDIDTMNEAIIDIWNGYVQPQDTVWHLGDFSWDKKTLRIVPKLNGHIHLIRGNHDDHVREGMGFASINDTKYLKIEDNRYWLSHYPHRSWRNSNYGCIHLHGHSHGNLPPFEQSLDVGWDVWGKPLTEEEVLNGTQQFYDQCS